MFKNLFIPLFLLFIFCYWKLDKNDSKIYGVKIYDYNGSFNELFNKWNDIGINTVFTNVDLIENNEFRQFAKKNNISTFVILPIFYAPEELEKDSSLFAITQFGKKAEDEWVKFVCPSAEEFKTNKINFVKEVVQKYHPTGISIDFIRHFTFWEKNYPETDPKSMINSCFDKRCINNFIKHASLKLPKNIHTELEISNWIKNTCFEEWVTWKNNLITKMVKDISEAVKEIDPNININLHAVPWLNNEFDDGIKNIVAQDFSSISKYVDFISPMTYAHMVKRKPAWINSVVSDIKNNSSVKILPSIQVAKAYLPEELSVEEFESSLKEALKAPSSGVVFWNWKSLENDSKKMEIVKNILTNQ